MNNFVIWFDLRETKTKPGKNILNNYNFEKILNFLKKWVLKLIVSPVFCFRIVYECLLRYFYKYSRTYIGRYVQRILRFVTPRFIPCFLPMKMWRIGNLKNLTDTGENGSKCAVYFRLGAESYSSLCRVGNSRVVALCTLLTKFACGQVSSPRLYRLKGKSKLKLLGLKILFFSKG